MAAESWVYIKEQTIFIIIILGNIYENIAEI